LDANVLPELTTAGRATAGGGTRHASAGERAATAVLPFRWEVVFFSISLRQVVLFDKNSVITLERRAAY
jgi:hypothetical protein